MRRDKILFLYSEIKYRFARALNKRRTTIYIDMIKKLLLASSFLLFISGGVAVAKTSVIRSAAITVKDTVPNADVMEVVRKAIYAANTFNSQAVANLYTPNAVVADDEPPYSWNGPTAGVQWIDAVEQAVKEYKISKFKGEIEPVKVYQQTADNAYVVVPVNYTGGLPGHGHFTARGAFTFVLRQINDKWLIKSQVWMPEKALEY